MTEIPLGYSPCPNDTFLFYGMVHGEVDTEGYRFQPVLEDVESLNQRALAGELPMTKVSFGVLGRVVDRYWCLRSGGALGRGCGPLVVARRAGDVEGLAGSRVAVPGLNTTANLLLDLRLGGRAQHVPLVFHEIMPAVVAGRVDAGVIIHESRFTYADHGLVAIEDLGHWWEQDTGLPIPLGGILLRRDLGCVDPRVVQRVLRRSVEFALDNPDEPMAYVRQHAQEMQDAVIREHIGLYVNDYSVDLGEDGARAVVALLQHSRRMERASGRELGLFPEPG